MMESIPHDTRLAGPEITDGAALYGVCECGKYLKPNALACANCTKGMCIDCEDDAALCECCGKTVCPDCQATARRRAGSPYQSSGYEYLCNPCCAEQDAAREALGLAITDQMCHGIFEAEFGDHPYWPPELWLCDIVDRLEATIERAKESL